MDDEQLGRELERRADAAPMPDLLPAVSRRLNERSQPARVARWAPLAGLAGAAVIVLALIVALPRFGATPSATSTPSVTAVAQLSAPPTTAAPQSPMPTTISSRSFTCSDSMTLTDQSGSVISCTDAGVLDYHSNHEGVVYDAIDPNRLHVTWGQSDCVESHQLLVTKAPDGNPGIVINVTPSSFDPSCSDGPEVWSADLELARAVDLGSVVLAADRGVVQCGRTGDFGRRIAEIAIYDGAAVVASCTQTPAESGPGVDSMTEAIQPNQIRVRWIDEEGPAYVPVTLNRVGNHYELASRDWCNSCSPRPFEMTITFNQAVDVSSLWVGLDGQAVRPPAVATPTPSSMAAAAVACLPDIDPLESGHPGHPTVLDETGLVASCITNDYGLYGATFVNPDDDLSKLRISWLGSCDPSATLHLRYQEGHYLLDVTDRGCQLSPRVSYVVTLTLASPVGANEFKLMPYVPPDTGSEPTGYTVRIAKGLQPTWTAPAAADAAYRSMQWSAEHLGHAAAPAQILSVELVRGSDVPEKYGGPYTQSVIWVLHAVGTYVFPRPGQPPIVASDGFITYDDATGDSIGFGTFNTVSN